MNYVIDVPRFREEYRRAIRDIARFVTPEHQHVIARHNPGLEPGRTNLTQYLVASEKRYVQATVLFNSCVRSANLPPRVLDVGGFLGAYPLALARLKIPVTLAEVYPYYGGALDELASFLSREGIEVWDSDFTSPLDVLPHQSFTWVTNMAMLEHLADSPEQLMRNLHAVTHDRGALVVEVPNIAYWPRRWSLLRGHTIHPPLEEVFSSAAPFLGHHREYTVADLQNLLRWTGFRPETFVLFNYSLSLRHRPVLEWLPPLAYYWPSLVFPRCRELIMALATPERADESRASVER